MKVELVAVGASHSVIIAACFFMVENEKYLCHLFLPNQIKQLFSSALFLLNQSVMLTMRELMYSMWSEQYWPAET